MAKTSLDAVLEEETPAVLFMPMSDFGGGFFPLMMRAWIRSLIVANAAFQKWPITLEIAAAELGEGSAYLSMIKTEALMPLSEKTIKQYRFIKKIYENVYNHVQSIAESNPKGELTPEMDKKLRELTEYIFTFLTLLDVETLGLVGIQTDAGKKL